MGLQRGVEPTLRAERPGFREESDIMAQDTTIPKAPIFHPSTSSNGGKA
jgi:hypothetical protein